MKKKFALFLFVAFFYNCCLAQITNYGFSARNATYTKITGTVIPVSTLQDGVSGLTNIGFNFWYDGVTYSTFGAGTNGKIRLGDVLTAAREASNYSMAEYPERPVLAPLWDHLGLSSPDGISYQTSGNAPSRVLTIQWSQVRWTSLETNPAIEFQLKLYEASNKIEFIYNRLSGPVFGAFAFIGITAVGEGDGNYLSLTNTTSSPEVSSNSLTILGTKPFTNQVYTFTPPTVCSAPANGGVTLSTNSSICAGYQFTLGVDAAFNGTGRSYQWQSSTDGINNWQNIPGAGSTTLTTSQTAATWYRRGITCGGVTAYSSPVLVALGAGAPVYASIPYEQNFNGQWLSNCQIRELPSLNWQNNPQSGDRSWRRNDDYLAGGWDDNNEAPSSGDGNFARFHVHGASGAAPTGDLDLYVDCSITGEKELRFSHLQPGPSATDLSVYYSTDGGVNFNLLATIKGVGVWRKYSFILPSNSAKTIVRFRGKGQNFGSSGDIGIDNVQVVPVTCFFPASISFLNIQQNTAEAEWTSTQGAIGYEYAVSFGYDPQPPASGTFVANASASLSGLAAATRYYLHVRTKCGSNSFSSWTSKIFTTSMNCGNATPISCGIPVNVSFNDGDGVYDLYESDPSGNCGAPAFGIEKMLRFAPLVSGSYNLKINASTSTNSVYYYIKDAAKGCAPIGWTCLGTTIGPKTLSLGNLSAGKEYFILLDLYTVVNAHTETLEITCVSPNADCVSAGITPVTASICSGGKQLLTSNGGSSYQWYRNGVLIDGATGSTYEAAETGIYGVAISNGSCTARATNTATISQASLPAPAITPSSATSFCEGGNVSLHSSATTDNLWYKDGQLITGASGQDFSVTTSGSYAVRTISGGCMSNLSSPVAITVIANPLVTITSSGNTTFCQGGSVQLTAVSASAISYQWEKDGGVIIGAGNNSYAATSSGSYTVLVTNASACAATSPAIVVEAKPNPPVPVVTISGPATFCQGGSVDLNTISASAISYQWKKDGSVISGAGNNSYMATSSGSYSVLVTDASGCAATSSAIVVESKPNPSIPVITTSGPVTFCEGGTVTLTSSAFSNNQWQKDGIVIGAAIDATYSPTASGNYTVVVTENGCSVSSEIKIVTINPLPAKPIITVAGNNLTSSATSGNQWYLNGAIITGAINRQYTVQASGLYTVLVTESGCSISSEPFNFVATRIVDPAGWNNEVTAYPNPIQEELYISNTGQRSLTIKIFDILGKIIYEKKLTNRLTSINMKRLSSGTYLLVISDSQKNETLTKTLIKQ